MVATCTHATVSLVALQKSNRVGAPPFPLRKPSQNGPRRPGSAAPRRNGAPWTAPGRSEETIPHKRERRVGKLNISPLHRRDHARATTPRGTCTAAEGLDAETFRG